MNSVEFNLLACKLHFLGYKRELYHSSKLGCSPRPLSDLRKHMRLHIYIWRINLNLNIREMVKVSASGEQLPFISHRHIHGGNTSSHSRNRDEDASFIVTSQARPGLDKTRLAEPVVRIADDCK